MDKTGLDLKEKKNFESKNDSLREYKLKIQEWSDRLFDTVFLNKKERTKRHFEYIGLELSEVKKMYQIALESTFNNYDFDKQIKNKIRRVLEPYDGDKWLNNFWVKAKKSDANSTAHTLLPGDKLKKLGISINKNIKKPSKLFACLIHEMDHTVVNLSKYAEMSSSEYEEFKNNEISIFQLEMLARINQAEMHYNSADYKRKYNINAGSYSLDEIKKLFLSISYDSWEQIDKEKQFYIKGIEYGEKFWNLRRDFEQICESNGSSGLDGNYIFKEYYIFLNESLRDINLSNVLEIKNNNPKTYQQPEIEAIYQYQRWLIEDTNNLNEFIKKLNKGYKYLNKNKENKKIMYDFTIKMLNEMI